MTATIIRAGLLMELGSLLMTIVSASLNEYRVFVFLAVMAFMGVIYLWAFSSLFREGRDGDHYQIILFGLLFYFTILWQGPLFDNDIYRYLWDGKVLLSGINPYRFTPGDPALAHLRDELFLFIGYTQVKTVYPPLAQILFTVMRFLAGTCLAGAKFFLGLFFWGSIFALSRILALTGVDRRMVLAFAWNPLVLKEFANSGHIDMVVVFFFLLALWLFLEGREISAGVLLAAACLTKFYPIFILPAFFWRSRRRAAFLSSFILTGIALYLPFLSAGPEVFGSLGIYLRYWLFNHGPYGVWEWAVGMFFPGRGCHLARILFWIVALFSSFILAIRIRSLPEEAFCRNIGLFLFGLVIFSPTVMPWYLVWSIPLLAFQPLFSLLGFTLVVNVSYLYYFFFRDIPAIRWMEYALLFLLLFIDWLLLSSDSHPWRRYLPGKKLKAYR